MNIKISRPISSLLPLFSLLSSITTSSISTFCSQTKQSNSTLLRIKPSRHTYLSLLKSSTALASTLHGLSVHAHILKSGYQEDIVITTSLINLLFCCSDINSARNLFDEMGERDAAAWNSMLSGFSRNGYFEEAVSWFRVMCSSGEEPNSLTLSVLLQVCGSFNDQRLGRSVHGYIVRHFEFGNDLSNFFLVYYNKF